MALVNVVASQLRAFVTAHAPRASSEAEDRLFHRSVAPLANFESAPRDEVRATIRATLISMPAAVCEALPSDCLVAIDQMLASELDGVVDAMELPCVAPGICVWQGDMARLRCDCVVNPANNALLGCFLPSHRCLDNILHAQAGPRLRIACSELLRDSGIKEDENGQCRVTPAFSLPSKFVFHTVGPCLVDRHRGPKDKKDPPPPPRAPTPTDERELGSCYMSCLDEAHARGLRSIAFCCISTGIFGYPNAPAADIALNAVLSWFRAKGVRHEELRVVFNVFKDEDLEIYMNKAPVVFKE